MGPVEPKLDLSADTWHVALQGRSVLMLTIDYRVSLHLHGDDDYDGLVVLEAPFEVISSSGEAALVDPARKEDLGPVLSCFEKVVERVAVSREEGSLVVNFTDGTIVRAASDAEYEAWEVSAAGVKIIATPGGGEPALFAG